MKTENNRPALINLSKEELKELLREVKETVAMPVESHNKVFSAADLWNIQRMRKYQSGRRENA